MTMEIGMRQPKRISLEEAAAVIADGDTVSVSSSSGLGCPDALLKAIGDRFRGTGKPRDLTMIHPIAAGDMYGIEGVDHIAEPGLIKRIIAGSYPSGPSGMPSPKIWQLIDGDEIEAYNLPSGVIFHMHADAAAGRPRGHRAGRRVRWRRVALLSRHSDRCRYRAGHDRRRAWQHFDRT